MSDERDLALLPLGSLAPQPGVEWSPKSIDRSRVMSQELRIKVIQYLIKSPVFLAWMEYTRDAIGDRFGVHGGSAIASDGRYYWRLDAVEYIKEYGISVPDVAVQHMESQGWNPPEFDRQQYLAIYEKLEAILGSSGTA